MENTNIENNDWNIGAYMHPIPPPPNPIFGPQLPISGLAFYNHMKNLNWVFEPIEQEWYQPLQPGHTYQWVLSEESGEMEFIQLPL